MKRQELVAKLDALYNEVFASEPVSGNIDDGDARYQCVLLRLAQALNLAEDLPEIPEPKEHRDSPNCDCDGCMACRDRV